MAKQDRRVWGDGHNVLNAVSSPLSRKYKFLYWCKFWVSSFFSAMLFKDSKMSEEKRWDAAERSWVNCGHCRLQSDPFLNLSTSRSHRKRGTEEKKANKRICMLTQNILYMKIWSSSIFSGLVGWFSHKGVCPSSLKVQSQGPTQ